ncbi:MAG: hypothetical protein ACRDA5_01415, partial [Clostridium sp.]
LIGLEDDLHSISEKLIELGYSDMFEVGNIDECVEDNNCVAVSYYDEEETEYKEIIVEFEIVTPRDLMNFESNLVTVVKITDISDI